MALPAVSVSQSPEEKFREYLASRRPPQRYTEQQRDLVRYVFAQHSHFDADQLIDALKTKGDKVSRATVYRTLSKLVDAGLLRELEIGRRKCYEHDYGYPQHEHLQCDECRKMIEFQIPALEEALRMVCREHRFNASGHVLIVRGTCAECNQAKTNKKRMLDLV